MFNDLMLQNLPEALMLVDPVADEMFFVNKRARKLLRLPDESRPRISQVFCASLPQLISFSQEVLDRGEGICDELVVALNEGEELRLEVTASATQIEGREMIQFCLRDKECFQKWRVKNSAHKHHHFGLLQWHRIHEVFQQIEKENQLILHSFDVLDVLVRVFVSNLIFSLGVVDLRSESVCPEVGLGF